MSGEAQQHYLQRLREYRNRRDPDLTLGFLHKQFQREVARPHKQLGQLVEVWQRLVPESLVRHSRLEGLSRGVLRVSVDSSAHLYELDQLLRAGLQRQIVREHRGPALRRVQLRVAPSGPAGP